MTFDSKYAVGRKREKTYILDLRLSDAVEALGNLTNLVRLAAVDQGSTGGLKAGLEGLSGLESTELGQRNGLLDLVTSNLPGSRLLENVNHVLAGSSNLVGLSRDCNGEETGVGVGVVFGCDTDLREALGGLGEERETRSPLDGRLAAEEGRKNGSFRLVARSAKGARAREGNHNGVSRLGRDTLFATIVLGGSVGPHFELARAASAGDLCEELTNPPGHLCGGRAASNDGDVRFSVGVLGKLGDGIGREVLFERATGGGSNVLTQTAVEGKSVGSVNGDVLSIGGKGLLSVLDEVEDELVQLVA